MKKPFTHTYSTRNGRNANSSPMLRFFFYFWKMCAMRPGKTQLTGQDLAIEKKFPLKILLPYSRRKDCFPRIWGSRLINVHVAWGLALTVEVNSCTQTQHMASSSRWTVVILAVNVIFTFCEECLPTHSSLCLEEICLSGIPDLILS